MNKFKFVVDDKREETINVKFELRESNGCIHLKASTGEYSQLLLAIHAEGILELHPLESKVVPYLGILLGTDLKISHI